MAPRLFGWKIPMAFTYFSTRMILAAATALLLCIFLGPRFIKKLYEMKIGQAIRSVEECPLLAELHGKKKDTPTMGGILILFSMRHRPFSLDGFAQCLHVDSLFDDSRSGILGGADDYLKLRFKNSKGLKARKKMLDPGRFFRSYRALFARSRVYKWDCGKKFFRPPTAKEQVVEPQGKNDRSSTRRLEHTGIRPAVYVPFFKDPILFLARRSPLFFLIVFVITGSSNAVNLTDGLDGLAAGCLVMVSLVLALFAFLSNHIDLARYLNILYIEGSGEIAVYLFALAGAALGFLWYNGYPAQVFMGDTGSLALGGILGVSAVLLRREMILAIAGAIFVAEALSVILQVLSYRYRNKKRIFLCAPLHHHFEYKGWPETKVVIRFWIISLLFAIIAVASLKLQ